jgi:hypothetical protein
MTVHDVFISHASEDKAAFVRPLASKLRAARLDVWYDEFSLHAGDSRVQFTDVGKLGSHFCRCGPVRPIVIPPFVGSGDPQGKHRID